MSAKRISLVEILLWLIVFILIIIVASPFALGFKIKSDYTAMLSDLSGMIQADIQIVRYDRGIYTSNAIIELRVPNLPIPIQFKEEIIHGPVYLGLLNQGKSPLVAAVVKGELVPVPGFESVVSEMFTGNKPLQYQNRIDFFGNVNSEGYIPPIQTVMNQPTGAMVAQSSGMSFNTNYSAAEGRISGEGSMPSFSLKSPDDNVLMEEFSFSYSGQLGQNDLLIGDSVVSLGKLEIHSAEDQFAMNRLTIRSVSTESGVLLDSQAQLNAQEIFASNERFGPVTLNFSINGLNADSIKQIQSIQQEMQVQIENGVPPEQLNAMMAGQMMGILPNLFKQADIKISPLSVQSELGMLEAQLDLSVEGLDADAPADPMFMFNAINLDMNLNIDEALLSQFVEWQLLASANQIQSAGDVRARRAEAKIPMKQKIKENVKGLVDENWLTYNDGVYSSELSLHQGKMMLNNKPIDAMKQIMSSMAPPQ